MEISLYVISCTANAPIASTTVDSTTVTESVATMLRHQKVLLWSDGQADAPSGPLLNELIGAAVAVTVIAAMTGSASGGQSIALPELAPHYLDAGVNPEALHRVVAISSEVE